MPTQNFVWAFSFYAHMILRISFFLFILTVACSSVSTIPKTLPAEKITFRNQTFDVLTIDPTETNIRFHLANEEGKKYRSILTLKKALEQKDQAMLFAMNGGMYLKDGTPQGLYIEKGKTITPLDTVQDAYGNFYLQPNGVFYIDENGGGIKATKQYQALELNPSFATQSGPMLVIDGALHPVFVEGSKNLHIRNGVGINAEGKVVFAISDNLVNLYDFAMLFKEKLGCKNALYLDGFVSRAYIPSLKREQLDGNFGVIITATKE